MGGESMQSKLPEIMMLIDDRQSSDYLSFFFSYYAYQVYSENKRLKILTLDFPVLKLWNLLDINFGFAFVF